MKMGNQIHLQLYHGGTGGFGGVVQVIIPYKTACFEYAKRMRDTNSNIFHTCTIANNPRVPEHCIEYALEVEWDKSHDRDVDKDSIEDVEWIYKTALERAKQYKIEGVTYNLTLGVIKNIIPAISSTNSLIAASTVMEALKIWTGFSKRLNSFCIYNGHDGIYSAKEVLAKIDGCEVCSKHVEVIKVNENDIWKNVLKKIIQISKFNSNREFRIFHNNLYIYSIFKEKAEDTALSKKSHLNENKTIKELVDAKDIIIHKIFEIIPTDDINDVKKIRLKRPQDFEDI